MDASVVVPTRNRRDLLATTLRSVVGQRDVDIEVIVVDDASSDGTSQAVAALDHPRLRIIRHVAPVGPNAARNRGAREAGGRWLAFVDDDDLWAPDKLTRQLHAAEAGGRDWAYAGSVNVNERLEVVHGIPPPSPAQVMAALRRFNPIPASASNVVIRRTTFAAAGAFNESLRTCEEWDLWIRLAVSGPPAWVPSPLVAYRMHPGNAILDVEAIVEGARMIEQLHDTTIDWGHFHRWIAQLCVRGGRRGDALRQYARALLAGSRRDVGIDLARLLRGSLHRRLGRPALSRARRPHAAWEDRARLWIEELRRLEMGAVGGAP